MSGTKSKQVRNAEIKVISDLLDKWKSDQEIMDQLSIPKTTYYRYKQQIFKEDKKLLAKLRTNELEHHIMQVRKALEYCIKINRDICENSADDAARRESSKMIIQAKMGLLNLILEHPHSEQVRIIARDVTEDTSKLEDKQEQSI